MGSRELVGHGRQGGRTGQSWSGSCLPTPNGVCLATSIADTAAEAGQPGCGPLHLGHGALEPGLKAREGTRLLTGTTPPILSCNGPGGNREGKLEQGKEKLKPSRVQAPQPIKQDNLRA